MNFFQKRAAKKRILASGFFDPEFYLQHYPDVATAGLDPLEHFLKNGGRESRSPSRKFDGPFYVLSNPEAARADNILLDWLREGKKGRRVPPVPLIEPEAGVMNHCDMTASDLAGRTGAANLFETAWHDSFAVARGARSPSFAPRAVTPVQRNPNSPKVVAFYLPQFHPIKENDEWWGKGFTEWTNVTKAVPQFWGHYQPRFPLDLGYYDLRNIDVIRSQIELAAANGVDAFCFHYYWFDGKRLLERPVEAYLADNGKTLDFPFCLCWANENWTRRWDGAEADILMEQSHSLDDHAKVIADLLRFFSDPRYLKVDGKPVMVVYRPAIIKDLKAMVTIWREAAQVAGLPGLHLVATNAFGFSDAPSIGFDALCEFPPHNIVAAERNHEKKWFNHGYEGRVYAYSDAVDFSLKRLQHIDGTPAAKLHYPTVMMGWDNEARKPGRSSIFDGCVPAEFHRWLDGAFKFANRNHAAGKGLLFVNAWNEWAEGTYLEPDRHFGHAFLWAVRAIQEAQVKPDKRVENLVRHTNTAAGARQSDAAVCLHLFYPDLIDELASRTRQLQQAEEPLDVLISIPRNWSLADVQKAVEKFAPKHIILVENRGRDVLPFFQIARQASKMGYRYGCKVHSKKSPQLSRGDDWRRSIYDALLSVERASRAKFAFEDHPEIGLYAPASMIKSCRDSDTMRDNLDNAQHILSVCSGSLHDLERFIAGTMFWFRFDAIKWAIDPRFDAEWFGPELGAIDGTMAHSFERLMVYLCELSGYKLLTYSNKVFDPYL